MIYLEMKFIAKGVAAGQHYQAMMKTVNA